MKTERIEITAYVEEIHLRFKCPFCGRVIDEFIDDWDNSLVCECGAEFEIFPEEEIDVEIEGVLDND